METRKQMIQTAGHWLDIDKCEKAYEVAGKGITWEDYTYDWYNKLPDWEKCDTDNYWDMDKYYDDFASWWDGLTFAEQVNIYNKIMN